jgi:hypothetical protein
MSGDLELTRKVPLDPLESEPGPEGDPRDTGEPRSQREIALNGPFWQALARQSRSSPLASALDRPWRPFRQLARAALHRKSRASGPQASGERCAAREGPGEQGQNAVKITPKVPVLPRRRRWPTCTEQIAVACKMCRHFEIIRKVPLDPLESEPVPDGGSRDPYQPARQVIASTRLCIDPTACPNPTTRLRLLPERAWARLASSREEPRKPRHLPVRCANRLGPDALERGRPRNPSCCWQRRLGKSARRLW